MAEDWRLRDEQGNVRSLSTQELRDGLAAGSIASSAQVARPGAEFKPAFSVPELATAAIRAKRTPSIPPVAAQRPAPGQKAPGGPRPAARAVEVPPAPRSRRRIQNTLVGIHGDEEGVPASDGAPIVAPGAGGPAGNAPRAITQVPRYTPAPSSATAAGAAEVVIPRAPKAPTTLNATDSGWEDAEAVHGHSLFDDDDRTLVKRGVDARTGPRSQPPPLPSRPKPGDDRVPRTTVMGMGGQGLAPRSSATSSPRLVPPKQASTPPPPAVGPASRPPPPVPKRTPTPPGVSPVAGAPATAQPSSVRPPAPPARTPAPPPTSKTPAPPSVKPAAKPPSRTPAPPLAADAGPSKEATAAVAEAPKADAPKPDAPKPEPRSEGTPTVPVAQGRESATDVDEAPTSKMAVQIVHGAALAMRAALAAPHPGKSSASETGAGATPAPPVATPPPSEATVAALPPVEESASAAAAPPEERASSATPAAALPLPPASTRASTTSSSPPAPASTSAPPESDEEEGPQSGVEVPVSSLFAASAVWIAGLVLVFFVGRCSALDARAPVARRGVAATARLAMLAVAPGTQAPAAEPKPCWVTRQPSRWATQASKNVPFEMVPVPGGGAMLVGYAASDDTGVGAKIDLKSGKFTRAFEKKVDGGVGRMTPLLDAAGTPTFVASPAEGATVLAAPGTTPPLFVRFGKSGLDVLPTADAADGTQAHALEGDAEINAAMLTSAGPQGVFASFRRSDAVLGAWIGSDGKARGAVSRIAGSGGAVGKPRAGWNGRQIAVVFADKPEGGRWQVRLGRAGAGEVPATTELFELPPGGPGGDAIAPDVVGLPDGRWLVMWTEGASGSRAIRSITLGPDLAPIGDPIALSPPAGNFGQAQLGVVGSYVSVLFLQKGDEDFELWGAVLQCG